MRTRHRRHSASESQRATSRAQRAPACCQAQMRAGYSSGARSTLSTYERVDETLVTRHPQPLRPSSRRFLNCKFAATDLRGCGQKQSTRKCKPELVIVAEHQHAEMCNIRKRAGDTSARERRENRYVSSNSLVRCLPPQPIMQVCRGSAAAASQDTQAGTGR